MRKRTTKAQREEVAKGALLQRVSDIYIGGGVNPDEWLTLSDAPRIIRALKACWPMEGKEYIYAIGNIDEFETVEQAFNFLWRNDARA